MANVNFKCEHGNVFAYDENGRKLGVGDKPFGLCHNTEEINRALNRAFERGKAEMRSEFREMLDIT